MMSIEEQIINEAVAEREGQSGALLNGGKHTITRPDGTQYRPYARILIQPTVVEVARRYMLSFFERQGVGDAGDVLMDKMVEKLNSELSEDSKGFLGVVIMSAFLEGGVFCACGPGVGRREEFIKLATKVNVVEVDGEKKEEKREEKKETRQLMFDF